VWQAGKSDLFVSISELLHSGTLAIVRYSKKDWIKQRLGNWDCSRPQVMRKAHNPLRFLQRANLNHWTTQASITKVNRYEYQKHKNNNISGK
jgi:hypothetical protein